MSISTTLSNALTGLSAASRAAQIVSSNVANASTEGYARRELELSERVVAGSGAGVRVDGIRRIIDESLVRDRRLSFAALGSERVAMEFHQAVFDLIGQPDEQFSLSATLANLETALMDASSRPDSETRLLAVVQAGEALAGWLNQAADGLQQLRMDADRRIAIEVDGLNSKLQQVADLNEQILRARASGQDYPGLLDSRQKLIDEVSELVPLRQLPRENGTVALYAMNGALLIDTEPATFGFSRTEPIAPDMTQASGALSGLTLNGQPIVTSGDRSPMAGGLVETLFLVRDVYSMDVQSNLDAISQDLISRFEDPLLDPSLVPGDPGLFTDGGNALDSANVVGLSARISVNPMVVPADGGEAWRLRDGLAAATQGPVGDATILQGMIDRLNENRALVGGTLSPTQRSVAGFATDLLSTVGLELKLRSDAVVFEQSRFNQLNDAILTQGVDTDQELQKLILIEQSYAANAKVIQTADELIQLLIGL